MPRQAIMQSIREIYSSAVKHHLGGGLDEAEPLYRQILAADPCHADALHLLGVLDYQRGHHDKAVDGIARAIAIDPAKPAYRNNLGIALRALGRLDEAITSYRAALHLLPDYADAHANLGVALHETHHPDPAIAHFEAALRLNPAHVDAPYNYANLLQDRGNHVEAIPLYERAHRAAPNRADILNNLGNALLVAERLDEAIAAYRRAVAIDPANADAHGNLGAALAGKDAITEAGDAFAIAGRLRPAEPHWPIRIAALCPAVFPSVELIDRYRIGLEAVLDVNRGGVRLPPEAAATSGIHPSFNLAHHGRDDRALKAKFAAVFRHNFPPRDFPPRQDGPLRIGFFDARPQASMFLRCAGGIVERLDPERFRVVLLAPERGLPALKAAIRRPDAEFAAVPERLPQAADAIAAARCDVLYHWQIGSDPLNYFLPFARPAPIQCTSWGTHTTSGVPAVDYYLSSTLIESPKSEAQYTETLVPLATLPTYQLPIARPDPPASRGEFGLPDDSHLYMCLQRLQKLHPDFDPMLADILRRDPKGLAVLLEDRHGIAAGHLAARFAATIPDVAGRILFLPRQSHAAYLRLLSLADAVLDTPHYNAGGTAYDILGLGLPLVTLPGDRHVARYTLGCYRKMGVTDLVANGPEHYAELAVRVATDRDYRAEVVARIEATGNLLFEEMAGVREHERFFARAVASGRDRDGGKRPGQ